MSVMPQFTPTFDGVFPFVQPPQPVAFSSLSTSLGGIVGTASWGPLNTPVPFVNEDTLYDAFGAMTSDPNSLITEARNALDKGNHFVGVRVSDGTDTAAQILLLDTTAGTPGTLAVLTARYTGVRANLATATLSLSSGISQAQQPVYKLQISMPRAAVAEVFDNIVGWKLVANVPTPDTPTLIANLVAAVNTGNGVKPKSQYFTATAGASVATPNLTTYTASVLGSNGTAGITTAMLVGMDGAVRSGLWALRGTGVDTLIVAGSYDPVAVQAADSFRTQEYAFALGLLGPSGTPDSQIIAAMSASGLKKSGIGIVTDWVGVTDLNTGQPRLVSPLGHVLGHICLTPPEENPGNKPYDGFSTIRYTEKSIGQGIGGNTPSDRASAGILYITNQLPGSNGVFKLAHGQNASSTSNNVSGTDGINYVRLTNYLLKGIFSLCYQYVDDLQGDALDDGMATDLGNSLLAWLSTLKAQKRIQDRAVDTITGNTTNTVAAGYRYVLILVKYFGVARFLVPTLRGGTTVLISANSANAALGAAQRAA